MPVFPRYGHIFFVCVYMCVCVCVCVCTCVLVSETTRGFIFECGPQKYDLLY